MKIFLVLAVTFTTGIIFAQNTLTSDDLNGIVKSSVGENYQMYTLYTQCSEKLKLVRFIIADRGCKMLNETPCQLNYVGTSQHIFYMSRIEKFCPSDLIQNFISK